MIAPAARSLKEASVRVLADAYSFEMFVTTDNAERFTALQSLAAAVVERLP